MNFFRKPIIIIALLLVGLPKSGIAQYLFQVEPLFNYLGDSKRWEVSGNFVMPQATFNGVSRVLGNGNYYLGDTTIKRPQTGSGIGGSIGISMPFKATGHISCWAVDVALMGNMYTWTDINQTFGVDGSYTKVKPTLNASTLQVAIPLGVSYKIGNDVIETKRLAFAAAFGAGLLPQLNMTSLTGISGEKSYMAFGCTPYVKAEAAFLAGLEFKVRVMYTIGDIRLTDVDHALPTGGTDGPFRIVSNGNLILSLVFMPFSMNWHETAWWNTYDTYNEHDRLN